MDYVEQCFYSTTDWNVDNLTENVLATSDNVINFPIPRGFRFDVSSNSTDYNYSSFSFSNNGKLSGSMGYLYCSKPLKIVSGTKFVPLQNAVYGYRMLEPPASHSKATLNQRESMLYGKLYFPTRALEAMYINRFSPTSQMVLKCINLPKQTKNFNTHSGIMTLALQNDVGRYSREFIFSTNEALLGFKFLYNFGYKDNRYKNLFDKNLDSFTKNFHVDSSTLSLGTEFWYGISNMSPGFSSSLRYSTHSTSTGKPLTLTLSCNPILGNVSSSYSVRTSVSSTFSSKYDFNIYSYDSNLSLGCELWQLSRNHHLRAEKERKDFLESLKKSGNKVPQRTDDIYEALGELHSSSTKPSTPVIMPAHIDPNSFPDWTQNAMQSTDDKFIYYDKHFAQNNDVIKTFSKLVNESDFASVIKVSTSLQDKNVKFLWEGRFQGFLLSGGFRLDFKKSNFHVPVAGLQIQFSS